MDGKENSVHLESRIVLEILAIMGVIVKTLDQRSVVVALLIGKVARAMNLQMFASPTRA